MRLAGTDETTGSGASLERSRGQWRLFLRECGTRRCRDSVKLDIRVGEKVLFGKYSGTEVTVNGEDLIVMREEDIMGVVE